MDNFWWKKGHPSVSTFESSLFEMLCQLQKKLHPLWYLWQLHLMHQVFPINTEVSGNMLRQFWGNHTRENNTVKLSLNMWLFLALELAKSPISHLVHVPSLLFLCNIYQVQYLKNSIESRLKFILSQNKNKIESDVFFMIWMLLI